MVIPLGLEPAEAGIMARPPRDKNAPLLSRMLLSRMVIIGLTMAILTIGSVYITSSMGHDIGYIRTIAFIILIISQWANALNSRSEDQSLLSRLKTANHGLIIGLVLALASQGLIMFTPLSKFFGISPVPIMDLLVVSLITTVVIVSVSELHKLVVWLYRQTKNKRRAN